MPQTSSKNSKVPIGAISKWRLIPRPAEAPDVLEDERMD